MTTRKGRGARTQDVVAAWYRGAGWPDARDVAAGESGADIVDMLGLAPEVKARRGFEPLKWLRQAKRNAAGRLAFVVFRCDGQGETTVGEWGVLMTLADHTQLLHEAGYGFENGRHVRTATPLVPIQPRGYETTVPRCTCTRINTCWAANPHGHDVLCARHGSDLPLELPAAPVIECRCITDPAFCEMHG